MKKLFLLALPMLAVALPAPAAAQTGLRVELMAGYDAVKANTNETDAANESFHGLAYGFGAGFDIAAGPSLSVGVDGEFTLSTSDNAVGVNKTSAGRDIYVGGRVTARVSDSLSVYGRAGYTNFRLRFDNPTGNLTGAPDVAGNLSGVRAGVGLQISGDANEYYGVEARYSDYEQGVSRRQIMAVIGTRF